MNPFIFGKVVSGEAYCDRARHEDRLRDRLISGQNVYLQGPRRTGKTSLVERVGRRSFRKKYFRVDFWGVKSRAEAFELILSRWLEFERARKRHAHALEVLSGLNLEFSLLGARVKLGSTRKIDALSLDAVFSQLEVRKKRGTRHVPTCVFFDEFQALQQMKKGERDDFLGELRKSIQHLHGVSFVFGGSIRSALHEIFNHPKSPFFQAAEAFELGSIEPLSRFHRFLAKKFAATERKPTPEFWKAVEIVVGPNPSDTQRLCAASFEMTSPDETLGEATVDRALDRIFEHERDTYLMFVQEATGLQKRCLLGVAELGGKGVTSKRFLAHIHHRNGPGVLKALGAFVNRGLLYKEGREFLFVSPFLREWLLREFP
ncbi:MAG: hypothetical protein AAGA58_13815 [Verrucomicrobiota bacterium]